MINIDRNNTQITLKLTSAGVLCLSIICNKSQEDLDIKMFHENAEFENLKKDIKYIY